MKRKLFFLLAMLLVAFAGNAQNSRDVNGDGVVNMSDVTDVLNYILNPPQQDGIQTFTVNGVSFQMVAVEGGTFTMGATAEQGSDAYKDEKPAHQVTLSSYSIGKTEVTQALWQAVRGSNPSYFFNGSSNLPVEKVSWEDCQFFLLELNALTGKNFRLPTEAEWEFAARGGNKSRGYKYSGSNTLSNVAWYDDNSSKKSHPVATKAPNELGIYDMSGNVWEWCNDKYSSSYYTSASQTNPSGPISGSERVFRGGCWYEYARECRVSNRYSNHPAFSCSSLGLRLAAGNAQTGPDVNGDGVVNMSDVTNVLNYILNPPLVNQTFTVNGVSFDMIAVEGGTFTMGATAEQVSYADDDEKPTHQVTLSPYMIGKTEVTQELWEAVMGKSLSQIASELGNSTRGVGINYPMYYVSWQDCQEFITKLNALTGKTFRLPTEAEWEFAARGGINSQGFMYSGSNSVRDVAWWKDISSSTTHPVATKAPNELGIYDMSGNVWEWCSDWYSRSYYTNASQTNPTGPGSGSGRVCRGGSWFNFSTICRVSNRNFRLPTDRDSMLGLRLAL